MDIETAFDSLDHHFLISSLEKYGFGKNFLSWVKILLKNQESCVLNGGTTTKYFLLGRGAHQGDPVSAYLFILTLEILFHLMRLKPEIKGLAVFDNCYLYFVYADDTTIFLQDTISIKHMVGSFCLFSYFSGLKPNFKKFEIAVIGSLKGVQVAAYGLRCIDLNNDALKILGTHFPNNEKLKEEKKDLNRYPTGIENMEKRKTLHEKGKLLFLKQ